MLHWVVFFIGVAINFGAWAVDFYAIGRQASNYYKATYYAASSI
jgi:hypothetical protein